MKKPHATRNARRVLHSRGGLLRPMLLSVLGSALLVSFAYSRQSESVDAQQIIDRMVSVYASCASYMDEGEVRTVFITKEGRRTVVKPFSTAFVRPGDFRFEFRNRRGEEEWDQYIVWMQNDSIKSWWSVRPAVRTWESFSQSLAGPTGVSGGSSSTVPHLLMPESLKYHTFRSLRELSLLGEEEVEGTPALKIQGRKLSGDMRTVWVDKQRLLILKMFEKHMFKKGVNGASQDFETEQTTIYRPMVNTEIAAERLAFNAPEQQNLRK